ncbi:MAG TPA: hypothetical protein VMZ33_07815 [Candidatus Limnocylindrales bacterium]|nr:hypothetical protein [Candidatus Limnocylindrales bacterium]
MLEAAEGAAELPAEGAVEPPSAEGAVDEPAEGAAEVPVDGRVVLLAPPPAHAPTINATATRDKPNLDGFIEFSCEVVYRVRPRVGAVIGVFAGEPRMVQIERLTNPLRAQT